MKTQRGKSPEVNKEDIRRGLLTWEARPRGQGSGQPLQLRSQGWPSQESQERGWLGGGQRRGPPGQRRREGGGLRGKQAPGSQRKPGRGRSCDAGLAAAGTGPEGAGLCGPGDTEHPQLGEPGSFWAQM